MLGLQSVRLEVRAGHPLMELILKLALRPVPRVQLVLPVGFGLLEAKKLAVVGPQSAQLLEARLFDLDLLHLQLLNDLV